MITKLLILLLTLFLIPTASANPAVNLDIQSIDITASSTKGGNQRGAALAVLADGSLLLGGGKSGGEVFTYNIASKSLKKIATLIPANRRTNDSRFAINDIGVLSQSSTAVKFLVSYPRLGSERNCVEVVVEQLDLNPATQKVRRVSNWLITKPCVPISAVQHTSGRFAVIDQNTAYVTIGDLGYPQISDRKKRGDLGSIFKVSAKAAVKVSQGHRNAQGIVLFNNKDLLAAEHGPRGGDEINLIKQGSDYGWPFVTYGQPYGAGDYVRPSKTGTHAGFVEPLTYWVPSIAPTELVQLPNDGWGQWSNQLLLGTLREQSLVFLKLDQKLAVIDQQIVDVGERIRDLEVLPNGVAVATSDSGQLLLISLAK
jgi:glucose/arabinose dehydrogenase